MEEKRCSISVDRGFVPGVRHIFLCYKLVGNIFLGMSASLNPLTGKTETLEGFKKGLDFNVNRKVEISRSHT